MHSPLSFPLGQAICVWDSTNAQHNSLLLNAPYLRTEEDLSWQDLFIQRYSILARP